MRGNGTKQATTITKPPARLLDITRLLRRTGRVLTGVDRVERAYAQALAADDVPCFGIARTKLGFVLVAPDDLWPLVQRLTGHGKLGGIDVQARLTLGLSRIQKVAESEVRRAALARCRPRGLKRLLTTRVPAGFSYVNTGHSNVTHAMLGAVKEVGGQVSVFIHDVIPLEFPQMQRPGQPERFSDMMSVVARHADRVIYNAQDTAEKARKIFANLGGSRLDVVAHLGVDEVTPDPAEELFALMDAPYFVCVGTIEPRKNHAFLLDLWEKMGAEAPRLLICGARGWLNEDVFARLDALPKTAQIQELNGLSDSALARLVQEANGVLMPSLGEGFGLPVIEALRRGTPVLCNNLPVYRELAGNIPIYASLSDEYLWIKQIMALAKTGSGDRQEHFTDRYTWDAHFKTVLRLI